MAVQIKDQVWEEVFDRVARTVDGMGKRIDPGIIYLILALNANGIPTTFSCEGHLDHGYAYPWVWIPEQDQDSLNALLSAFYQHIWTYDDRLLVIEHGLIEDEVVLRNLGASPQEEREQGLRALKLKEYQQEMQAFAHFLKERFFDDQ